MHVGFQVPGAWLRAGACAVLLALAGTTGLAAQEKPALDVIYVPTPQIVVNRMLELVKPQKGEIHWDLGSGDGRIAVTAAKNYGTRSYGVDIDPDRIAEARESAKKEGVADRATFEQANLFHTDFSKANILTLYLLDQLNEKLRPTILDKLAPGSRVVSHAFRMGAWQADHHEQVDGRNIYMWTVPAKLEGKWDMQIGEKRVPLAIVQQFQNFDGIAVVDGKNVPIRNGKISGTDISFAIEIGGKEQAFTGKVNGNAIEGSAWKASRAS